MKFGQSKKKHYCYLVQNWVNLENRELIFPVFSNEFVKFGFKFKKNNEKYMFGIF